MVTRRQFVTSIGLASAMGAAGYTTELLAAGPPPEVTRLRLHKTTSLCNAALYVAEELLRAEGFTDIQYVGNQETTTGVAGARSLAAGEFDIGQNFAAPPRLAEPVHDHIGRGNQPRITGGSGSGGRRTPPG